MVGAGATGRAIALQLGTPVPGIRLVAIANRTPEHGERAFREAGFQEWRRVTSARAAEAAINHGIPVLTDDPSVLTTCPAVDIIDFIVNPGLIDQPEKRGDQIEIG